MKREAKTNHPVHELIRNRWSPYAYSGKPVEKEKLLSLFEAARWAPSSFNEQPWNFIVVFKEDAEAFARMLDCLMDANRVWAKEAPVLLLSVAKLAFELNGKPNRHAFHDVGLAMGNFCLQATALGLFVHQMAGFDAAKARQAFGIPEGYDPVAAAAVGYYGDRNTLPEKLKARETGEGERDPITAFLKGPRWDTPLKI